MLLAMRCIVIQNNAIKFIVGKVPGFVGLKLCPVSLQEVLYSAYSVPEYWVNQKEL